MPKRVAQSNDDYPPEEAQKRFMTALKAAVNTPPRPLKSMTRKVAKAQSKKRAKRSERKA
jgi:hypothetical protein